jgi:hypothetical protein
MRATFRALFEAVLLLALCFCGPAGWGQEAGAKQKAIDQMRQVARAMKQCSELVTSSEDKCKIHKTYQGPPTNLEWDVMPSKTVRSPFQGIIEFSLPFRYEDIDLPNLSKKAHQQCLDEEAHSFAASPLGASTRAEIEDEIAKKGPEWREGHYRYEFDVGSNDPELVKMLWIAKDRKDNLVTSEAKASERECWVAAAKSIGLKQENTK